MRSKVGNTCPRCGEGITVKRENKATKDPFIGCDQFPECKYSRNWTLVDRSRNRGYYPTHKGMDIDEMHEQGFGPTAEDAGFY